MHVTWLWQATVWFIYLFFKSLTIHYYMINYYNKVLQFAWCCCIIKLITCSVVPGHWLHAAAIKPSMEFQGIANLPLGLACSWNKDKFLQHLCVPEWMVKDSQYRKQRGTQLDNPFSTEVSQHCQLIRNNNGWCIEIILLDLTTRNRSPWLQSALFEKSLSDY